MAERDTALGQVVGRQVDRHLVAGDDADMVLAHLAAGVGDELMPVVQGHAKARIRQHFGDQPTHFNQFFFGHGP
jgi:hypothetical protein